MLILIILSNAELPTIYNAPHATTRLNSWCRMSFIWLLEEKYDQFQFVVCLFWLLDRKKIRQIDIYMRQIEV